MEDEKLVRYSYITFHVPFTAKPSIPYHIDSFGIILSASQHFHPDEQLKQIGILDITIYNEKEFFNLNKVLWLLKEFVIFLNLRWRNQWSLNFVLNCPFMDFKSEIREASSVTEILSSVAKSPSVKSMYYEDFDSFGNATVEFQVPFLNVREDFPKFLCVVLSSEEIHKRLTEQIQVLVLADCSDKLLFPLYENANLKYSLLISVFEDLFLCELSLNNEDSECSECRRPFGKRRTFKYKLKEFLSTLPVEKLRRDLYFKMFYDIYQNRNFFTHNLIRETREKQIQTLQSNIPKFGYSLSDHIEGGVGRLVGEDIMTSLIRKHLIEQLKNVIP